MQSVTFPNVVDSFKAAIQEVLAAFFNGAVHELNDTLITFPQAKIAFDIRLHDKPVGLTITILGDTVLEQREWHCHNPKSQLHHGIEIRAAIARTVIIAVPIQGGTNTFNRKSVDQAWGNLYALFAANPKDFADRNIFLPVLDLVPSDDFTRSDIAEVSGTFTCELRMKYAKYNILPS
jgi:hypothetical protein